MTREGFVFVNFDASTMNLPFNNVKSHVDLGACSWVDGMDVTCNFNWKDLANEFSSQSQWSQNPLGWFAGFRQPKKARLLGPLSLIKELSPDLWSTMTLLPRSSSEVVVRCDIYAKEGQTISSPMVERWKWMLEKELASFSKPEESKPSTRPYFAYQCGGKNISHHTSDKWLTVVLGRTIDLFAILAQHQRSEKMAKKKLQPAIRLTATADIDMEATALCDLIDGTADSPALEKCSKVSSFPQTIEW